MQHTAVADSHDRQPFSEKYCDMAASRASVSSSRRLALAPAQHEGDGRKRLRDCDRAGEAREEAGRGRRLVQQHMIGAFRHRRAGRIRDRDQRGPGAMR